MKGKEVYGRDRETPGGEEGCGRNAESWFSNVCRALQCGREGEAEEGET